jgi:hypothetical protein
MVAQAARIPVYSRWENVLGDGIVGGYLLSFEEVARIAVLLILGTRRRRAGLVCLSQELQSK